MFGDKEIEIVVSDFDETEYLLKSEANKKKLLEAKANVDQRSNLIEFHLNKANVLMGNEGKTDKFIN